MKKIIIDNMELLVDNYNRDFVKSEISGKNLIRIKCETKLQNEENENLKKLLDKKNFNFNIPDEKLQFTARKGEISYYYTYDNPFKDEKVEYTHVLEIIEFEEMKSISTSSNTSLESEIVKLKKRIAIIEKILLSKGLISKDDLNELFRDDLK